MLAFFPCWQTTVANFDSVPVEGIGEEVTPRTGLVQQQHEFFSNKSLHIYSVRGVEPSYFSSSAFSFFLLSFFHVHTYPALPGIASEKTSLLEEISHNIQLIPIGMFSNTLGGWLLQDLTYKGLSPGFYRACSP